MLAALDANLLAFRAAGCTGKEATQPCTLLKQDALAAQVAFQRAFGAYANPGGTFVAVDGGGDGDGFQAGAAGGDASASSGSAEVPIWVYVGQSVTLR